MTLPTRSDLQLLEVLRSVADFLYRHGIGDGAAAVDEAVRRIEESA